MAKLVIGNNKTVGVPVITKEIEKLPALGLLRAKDANGNLIPSTTESQIMDFTGVTDVSAYMLAYAYSLNKAISGAVDMSDLTAVSGSYACNSMFRDCTGLTSVDLGSLTIVGGIQACTGMFFGCSGLTSVDISSLTTISNSYGCQQMFANCARITSVDLSSLTTISGQYACSNMFQSCTGLTSVDLSSLTTLSGNGACSNMFYGCTGLISVDLSGVTTVTGNITCSEMFSSCTSLATVRIGNTTAIDFGTKTSQFNNIFNGCTQNIDVYAPAASQSAIEGLSGYPNFGGTGNVVWHWNTAE